MRVSSVIHGARQRQCKPVDKTRVLSNVYLYLISDVQEKVVRTDIFQCYGTNKLQDGRRMHYFERVQLTMQFTSQQYLFLLPLTITFKLIIVFICYII